MTIEQRLLALEAKVFGIIPLIKPAKENVLLDYPTASIIQGLYGIPYKNNLGDYVIYYYWIDIPTAKSYPLLATSKLTYWDFQNPTTVTGGAESVFMFKGITYGSNHKWNAGKCFQRILKATNGKDFLPISSEMELGEDGSFTVVGDTVYWYIRPSAYTAQGKPNRTIGLKKSFDMINWTATETVFAPTDPLDQFYAMPVQVIDGEFYGLLMLYRLGNNGQDSEQLPPYLSNEQTVTLYLTHSLDGKNFKICNGGKPFIERPAGIFQQYGTMFRDGDNVKMLVSSSPARHAKDVVKDKFDMSIYSIKVSDIKKYK